MLAVCPETQNPRKVKYSSNCNAESSVFGNHGDEHMIRTRTKSKFDMVPCSPMSDILREAKVTLLFLFWFYYLIFFLKQVPFIDFFSIDVEGFELQLLRTIDFSEVPIRVIVIETDHNKDVELNSIRELLESKGFKSHGLCCGSFANEVWVNPNFERKFEVLRILIFCIVFSCFLGSMETRCMER